MDHDEGMRLALELARQGEGAVEPNPMVGCVLIRDGVVIGKGYHAEFGGPHAEVNAIKDARRQGNRVDGASALVTLEPCSHFGKTGPCSQRLIDEGVSEVVIGHLDPFPEVSGNGIAHLRAAGIRVHVGVLEDECRQLNLPYLTRVEKKRPWVIAKWAMTVDGRIATSTGDSRWISSSESRQHVQNLRGRVDGILVGINTVLQDDPMLNARPADPARVKRLATRIVLDSRLRIPLDSKLVQTCKEFPVHVFTKDEFEPGRKQELVSLGCEVSMVDPTAGEPLCQMLNRLADEGMTNVLVEGGASVLGSFFEADLVDEVQLFVGPSVVGDSAAPGPVNGPALSRLADAKSLELVETDRIGNDLRAIYRRSQQIS